MFNRDLNVKNRIIDDLQNNLTVQVKNVMAQKPIISIMTLIDNCQESCGNISDFAILEINNINSLKRLKNLGAKIYISDNPQKEISDLDCIKIRDNGKFKCLVYTTEKIFSFDLYIYNYFLNAKSFHCNDYYIYNNRMIFVFGDTNEKKVHETKYFVLAGGVGDVFIFLPILYNIQKKENLKFIVIAESIYKVLCNLGFHDMIEFVDVSAIWHLLVHKKYRPFGNIANGFLFSLFSPDYEHEMESRFEVFCDHYNKMGVLANLSPKSIFARFINVFPYKWTNPINPQIKVAVQRTTSSQNEHGKATAEWPIEEMIKLIDYCEMKNIELINVCPHDEMRDKYPIDEGYRSLADLWGLLCEIDLFIGIDSAIGHMCALTGTPSLNLYFSYAERVRFYSYSCMPLSMNYTLFTKDKYPKSDYVIREMNNILFNGKELCSEFVPFGERKEGIHYEIG